MRVDPLEEFIACVRQANSSTLSEQVKSRVYARLIWRLADERQHVGHDQAQLATHSASIVRGCNEPS